MDFFTKRPRRDRPSAKGTYVETKQTAPEDDASAQSVSHSDPDDYHSRDRSLSDVKHTNRPSPRRSVRYVFGSWLLELSTCLLVFLILAAFILTLHHQQGKPLQTYTLGITINALTAIYTIILKTMSVFVITEGIGQLKWLWYRKPRSLVDFQHWDRASRGPWGSVVLLWVLKHRGPMGSLGALVLLVTIIMDPFAQQIIAFTNCELPDMSRVASAPRSNMIGNIGFSYGPEASLMPIDLQNAINAGTFGYQQQLTTPIDCPTGNCTFEPFYTIAYI